MVDFEARLGELGYKLPVPPEPKGAYLPVRRYGNLIFSSGTGANIKGVRYYTGCVGKSVTLEEARESGRLALLNNLDNIYHEVGDDIRYLKVLRLTGYVSSDPDFHDQAKVVDGASMLLYDIFGENGRHARSAIGVASLPFDLSVEIELVVSIEK